MLATGCAVLNIPSRAFQRAERGLDSQPFQMRDDFPRNCAMAMGVAHPGGRTTGSVAIKPAPQGSHVDFCTAAGVWESSARFLSALKEDLLESGAKHAYLGELLGKNGTTVLVEGGDPQEFIPFPVLILLF